MELLTKASTLVAIIALGYTIKRIGWVTDFRTLATIAVRITLPAALVTSFDAFTVQVSLLRLSAFALAAVLLGQGLTLLVERRRGRSAQAFGMLNVSNFNIGLFAMPYLATFLGPEAIVVASMFDIGNAIGAAGLGYGAGLTLAAETKPNLMKVVKTTFSSPVFITYLIVMTIGLLGWHLPDPVISFTATIGAANTFVAMLMIGVGLDFALERSAYRAALRYLLTRWTAVALAITALWLFMPFSPLEKSVVTTILCAPMAAMVSGFTEEAGLDVRVSTFMTTVTVLVAIVAMPLALALTT